MNYLSKAVNRIKAESDQFLKLEFKSVSKPVCICGNCASFNTMPISRNISVIYSKGTRELASVQMRIIQSVKNLLYYNPKIKIAAICLQSSQLYDIRNQFVVISKFAALNITSFDLGVLIRNNNIIFIDPVDAEINLKKFEKQIILVASSLKQFDYFKNESSNSVELIYHASDLRLMSIQTQKNFFSLGYFGSMHRLPEELISLETLNVIKTHLSYKPKFKLPDFIDSLKIHSAHLVVGTPVPKLVFKPFTKGLVATSVGAVTLISENDFEAISLLGNNYPYVAKNSSKKTVAEVVRFMEDTFLGEEWHIAQSMHKNLLPYCCEMNAYISWSTVLALSECRY